MILADLRHTNGTWQRWLNGIYDGLVTEHDVFASVPHDAELRTPYAGFYVDAGKFQFGLQRIQNRENTLIPWMG